jgi:hypothetical protein
VGQPRRYLSLLGSGSCCIYFLPLAVVYKSWGNIIVDLTTAAIQDSYTSAHVGRDFVSLDVFKPQILLKLTLISRTTILTGYVQFTAVFSIPLRSQIVDLSSPVKSGIRLLPLVSATAFGSLFGGGASAKRNLTFYTMSIGTALMLVGTALLSYALPADGSHTNAQYGYQAILGLGLGMSVSTATFMNSLEVEFIDHG